MLHAFSNLKSIVKSNKRSTESLIFYLNYRVTFLILIFCCVLVSTTLFFGKKIECLSKPSNKTNLKFLNAYCWSTSTYSVNKAYLKEVGVHIPHPGVDGSDNESDYEYRNFYQYVHIVLFLQAILFYLPHLIWKNTEPGFIHGIPDEINKGYDDSTENDGQKILEQIANYIKARRGSFRLLPVQYFMCELLSLINVLIQAYLLDIFLHGKFINLGLFFEAYYSSEILSDPLRLFPIVTTCRLRKQIRVAYSLCTLPINAINGKIFLFIWLWFTILVFLTAFDLLYKMACFAIPGLRIWSPKVSFFNTEGNIRSNSYETLAWSGIDYWFILSSLKRNTDPVRFYRITDLIHSKSNSVGTEYKDNDLKIDVGQKLMDQGNSDV